MKKGIWLFIVFSPFISAMSLLETYELAKQNDPVFLEAHSQYLVDREDLSLAYAALSPQLNLSGAYAFQNKRDNGSDAQTKSHTQQLTLRLDQPIFNAAAWSGLAEAKASVKQAEARFQSATQELFYKVASRYLEVSVAASALNNVQSKVKAINALLDQAKHQFNSGLIAKASVDEAQAAFESVKADEISAQTNLANAQESIFTMTGQFCKQIYQLSQEKSSLSLPDLESEETWQELALKQNYHLQSAQWAFEAAKARGRSQNRSRMPELSANAEYVYDHESSTPSGISQAGKAGLSLSWRLYEGGAISAKQRKASWAVMGAKANLMKTHRSVESNARKAYRDVHLGAKKVVADRQTLRSRLSALESIKAAFSVEERAMADVLDAESDYFDAKQQLVADLRSWVLAILRLKQVVGQLAYEDLEATDELMGLHRLDSKKENKTMSLRKSFSIQLSSSTHEEAAYHFIRHHRLVGQAYVLPGPKKDQFLVLVGAYETSEAAKAALKALSPDLQKMRPWVRQINKS